MGGYYLRCVHFYLAILIGENLAIVFFLLLFLGLSFSLSDLSLIERSLYSFLSLTSSLLFLSRRICSYFEPSFKLAITMSLAGIMFLIFLLVKASMSLEQSSFFLLASICLMFGVAPFERAWIDFVEGLPTRFSLIFLLVAKAAGLFLVKDFLGKYETLITVVTSISVFYCSLLFIIQSSFQRALSYYMGILSSLMILFLATWGLMPSLILLFSSGMLFVLRSPKLGFQSWQILYATSHRYRVFEAGAWLSLNGVVFYFAMNRFKSFGLEPSLLYMSFLFVSYRLAKHLAMTYLWEGEREETHTSA